MSTDRIVKSTLLRAPLSRVWRALTDSAEFGAWFGMRVDGPFEAGRVLNATIVPTTVDDEVAKAQKPYEGMAFTLSVERVEPERLFSFRWTHPIEPTGKEPPSTLVEFTLEQRDDGVLITVTESGFESIPLDRRAAMFEGNAEGWAIQMRLISEYLVRNP